jgi:hydroxymethylpyrimidine/phosphomethylpyrimidine kinase
MKTILVIAGLDPSGGAGLLADARVATEHGVRVVGVVTALTVQDTMGVRAANPVPREVIADQLAALLADVEVDAVKIGMLADAELAPVVASALAATRAPIVWDPALLPSRGGVPLLAGDAAVAKAFLLPEVRVVTPNLSEAAALAGCPVTNLDEMRAAAVALRRAGAAAVLVKGGHLAGDPTDLLYDGSEVHTYTSPRVDAGPLHGTGCVLSTAIACALAEGAPLPHAVEQARRYLGEKLRHLLSPGRGARVLV